MHEEVEGELEDVDHGLLGHLCAGEQAADEQVELAADDVDGAVTLLLDEGGDERGRVRGREEEDARDDEYLVGAGRFLRGSDRRKRGRGRTDLEQCDAGLAAGDVFGDEDGAGALDEEQRVCDAAEGLLGGVGVVLEGRGEGEEDGEVGGGAQDVGARRVLAQGLECQEG